MAEFKEEFVINALHTDKAVIGKKYWCSDNLLGLKRLVETNNPVRIGTLTRAEISDDCFPFHTTCGSVWQFLYPYEEPPMKRMTNIQLMEWLAKGNGLFNYKNGSTYCYTDFAFMKQILNEEVNEDIVICTWDSYDWIEPTVDIYERDCQHTDNIL